MTHMLHSAVVVCLLSAVNGSAWAQLQPIPKESGFSGFVNLGALYLNEKSNMVVGNEIVDIGNKVIDSLTESPPSQDDLLPMFNFNLRYTFANTRTQLFLGSTLEDFLRLDLTSQAGVRQGVSAESSVFASLVFSTFPTKVWADPYVVNTPRQETDRDSLGVRLNWDRVLDSNFTFQYTFRDIEIDNELSGLTQLALPTAQASLLDRNGDLHRAEVFYRWKIAPRHRLLPAYRYNRFDLDGDAMASDRHILRLTYTYQGDRIVVAVNADYGQSEYDALNPIYLARRDENLFGAGVQLFWLRPFGAPKGVSLLGTVAYFDADSEIAFYDTEVLATGLSVFWRF